jgi:uncharacterized protein
VRWVGIALVMFSVWFSNLLFAQDEKPIRILSIDGGGIRGVIPAVILYDLENQLKKPISQIFDMVAGSSIGGVIALSLTMPDSENQPLHSTLDLVDFFIDLRKDIFKSSLRHSIKTLGGLIGPQYESDGFKDILNKRFGNKMLSQALIPTLVTGYHIDGNVGIEFFSPDAKKFPHDMDCLVREVAMATSAAPAYFDCVDVHYEWGILPSVTDGCLYKISPALLPFVRAQNLYRGRTIEVYSLGTGQSTAEDISLRLNNRGIIHWLSPLLRHIWKGSIDADDSILSHMLNRDGRKNYFRLNPRIDFDHSALDDISDENLSYLLMTAALLKKSPQYQEILERLKE